MQLSCLDMMKQLHVHLLLAIVRDDAILVTNMKPRLRGAFLYSNSHPCEFITQNTAGSIWCNVVYNFKRAAGVYVHASHFASALG